MYQRIYERLRSLIVEGTWPVGMRLPSSRQLAADLGVSRTTTFNAINQLVAEGFVEARDRSGVFVSLPAASHGPASGIDSTSENGSDDLLSEVLRQPVDLFPLRRWDILRAAAWRQWGAALLERDGPQGHLEFREAVARVLCPARGFLARPDQVIVTPGPMAALRLVLAATCQPGSTILVERPVRLETLRLLEMLGHRVELAEPGWLDQEPGENTRDDYALVLLAPGAHSAKALIRLRELAEAGVTVVEDDSAPPLSPSSRLAQAARAGSVDVVYLRDLSATMFPGLALTVIVAPPAIRNAAVATRSSLGLFCPLLDQVMTCDFIVQGYFAGHVRRVRDKLRVRREHAANLLGGLGLSQSSRLTTGGEPFIAVDVGEECASSVMRRLRECGFSAAPASQLYDHVSAGREILIGVGASAPLQARPAAH